MCLGTEASAFDNIAEILTVKSEIACYLPLTALFQEILIGDVHATSKLLHLLMTLITVWLNLVSIIWSNVQELEKSDCAALRNNLVVAMADFCVRYTALVDG